TNVGRNYSLMNLTEVEKIANAVLYEGYMLYPYRASAVKNKHRFNFGALYPEAWSEQNGDPCVMHTECLLEGEASTTIQVKVRFLHLLSREIFVGLPPNLKKVAALQVDGKLLQAWQEAVECDVTSSQLSLGDLLHQAIQIPFSFDASNQQENIESSSG